MISEAGKKKLRTLQRLTWVCDAHGKLRASWFNIWHTPLGQQLGENWGPRHASPPLRWPRFSKADRKVIHAAAFLRDHPLRPELELLLGMVRPARCITPSKDLRNWMDENGLTTAWEGA